jgi:hypothetical protein
MKIPLVFSFGCGIHGGHPLNKFSGGDFMAIFVNEARIKESNFFPISSNKNFRNETFRDQAFEV